MSTPDFKIDPECILGISSQESPPEEDGLAQRVRFSCPTCPNSYATLQNLRFHELNRNSSRIMCPVETCRRWFSSEIYRRSHIQKSHATWNNACLMCDEKFDKYDELFDHLGRVHGSSSLGVKGEELDLVRVKSEVILDDEVEIGGGVEDEIKPDIKEQFVVKVENETWDGVDVKLEPFQDL
ncbi:Zinc finger protein GLIS2 [Folsomia candida]|uniref:Zinc finger protein GLIS2 n=1 Tax=Folsomia candida TaxID=158441 RepID=A0A226D9U0_FOLCA|nr:Zinc finger protein GLIS2 [Folsomia candida]